MQRTILQSILQDVAEMIAIGLFVAGAAVAALTMYP